MLKIKNEYQQDLLSADGFFTTPFADVQTVEKISSIYYAHFSDNGTPFYSTSFHPD
ncbi:MAG: hypothetical protein JWN78_2134, partial [Bacteroidota bacterium]|nr:hypothetical protein [Bacteroidota bacterium]